MLYFQKRYGLFVGAIALGLMVLLLVGIAL